MRGTLSLEQLRQPEDCPSTNRRAIIKECLTRRGEDEGTFDRLFWQGVGAEARFGAPLREMTVEHFYDQDLVYQIRVAPNRIDIIMGVAGVTFEEAWADHVDSTYGGVPIAVMGRKTLIRAKRASGRKQDLLELERLEANASD